MKLGWGNLLTGSFGGAGGGGGGVATAVSATGVSGAAAGFSARPFSSADMVKRDGWWLYPRVSSVYRPLFFRPAVFFVYLPTFPFVCFCSPHADVWRYWENER
ncbi:uncharacterized protein B0T23DRAFT_383305 [Neurospora hispaniola]|uniref:Uncharacterized protein n=1 Tax=Neurospora hispaniola TaxID=588809 RepID=A0AAJ0I6J7_9PEZI|nr:hypothetical protein B0T23DRAFT_383305 [Neurospora hispaniola]